MGRAAGHRGWGNYGRKARAGWSLASRQARRWTGSSWHIAVLGPVAGCRSGEASGGLSNMPLHPADLGTDNFEQEFTLNLLQNQEQVLQEIADALERIRARSFGLCEECQQPIPAPRLDALPYARHCMACARKLQPGA